MNWRLSGCDGSIVPYSSSFPTSWYISYCCVRENLGCVVLLPSLFSTISQCSEFVDLMWVAASLINGKSTPTPTPRPRVSSSTSSRSGGMATASAGWPWVGCSASLDSLSLRRPMLKGLVQLTLLQGGPCKSLWPPSAAWRCLPSWWADCNMQNQTGPQNYLSVKHHCVPECLCIFGGSWWKARVLQTALII